MSDLQYITLEQWRGLVAVVEYGGYAQAAEALHKSQSSVTYAVQKIESVLGIKAFEMEGRKAILTPTGQFLVRRARALLSESVSIERAARRVSAGWEAEIRIAVEILFPTWLLFECLEQFAEESPHTRIEVFESVLGGTTEILANGEVEFAISNSVPAGFVGTPLIRLRSIPVAHPDHALHRLGRELTLEDLRAQRHLVVRESGSRRSSSVLSVDTTQRWTVSHLATSIQAVTNGYGFAWYPEEKIRAELRDGSLKPLPVQGGGERFVQLYLVFADPDGAGPGTLRLGRIFEDRSAKACEREQGKAASPAVKV